MPRTRATTQSLRRPSMGINGILFIYTLLWKSSWAPQIYSHSKRDSNFVCSVHNHGIHITPYFWVSKSKCYVRILPQNFYCLQTFGQSKLPTFTYIWKQRIFLTCNIFWFSKNIYYVNKIWIFFTQLKYVDQIFPLSS